MDNNEKPIILVVVTFFLAMTLVYITFFRRHGFGPIAETLQDTSLVEVTMSGGVDSGAIDNFSGAIDNSGTLVDSGNFDGSGFFDGSGLLLGAGLGDVFTKNKENNLSGSDFFPKNSTDTTLLWKDKIQGNSGLSVRYGSVELADLLGLSVSESFTDTGGTYYSYLGTGNLDTLAPTVRRLGGNVLAIETKNDINKNLLRGDRILFVNIPKVTFVRQPTEKKLLVAMVVYVDDDKWLIVAKIDRYYASKPFMKTIFEQLYGKPL